MSARAQLTDNQGGVLPSAGAILDALTTGVLLLDGAGVVQYMNPAAESLFGLSVRRATGHRLDQFVHTKGDLMSLVERAIEQRETCVKREVCLVTLTEPATTLVADVRLAPMPGNGHGVVVEIVDAQPRVRQLRELTLQHQHLASRTMTRQLAHEIKNPLGGLRGAAQLLARELGNGLTEYTDVIIHEADRLSALVDNMLGPVSPPTKQPVNIHELLDHLRRLLSAEAPTGVSFEDDYDPSLPPIPLDRDQILQAMINLGRNALQVLGDDGGVIRFRTRAQTQVMLGNVRHPVVARIDFEDSGPGVSDALRDTLFYPLVTGRADGTGLGLAIAQELVNRHNGLIELDHQAPVTRFSLYLPIVPQEATA